MGNACGVVLTDDQHSGPGTNAVLPGPVPAPVTCLRQQIQFPAVVTCMFAVRPNIDLKRGQPALLL
jgi:hypothetical protein